MFTTQISIIAPINETRTAVGKGPGLRVGQFFAYAMRDGSAQDNESVRHSLVLAERRNGVLTLINALSGYHVCHHLGHNVHCALDTHQTSGGIELHERNGQKEVPHYDA